jgi:hypothetical protein
VSCCISSRVLRLPFVTASIAPEGYQTLSDSHFIASAAPEFYGEVKVSHWRFSMNGGHSVEGSGSSKRLSYVVESPRGPMLDAGMILAQSTHFGAPEQLLQRPPFHTFDAPDHFSRSNP